MLSRRAFIQITALVGTGLATGCTTPATSDAPPPKPVDVTKYVDSLPIPAVLRPISTAGDADVYEIKIGEFRQKLHSELAETTVWGYQGTYPGPTIEARTGRPVRIKFVNDLPEDHLFAVDHTLHGAEDDKPDVRVVTHLHGGHVPPDSDGWPESWVAGGGVQEVTYPNDQLASTLWFHDHAMGITRLNVYAGLAAFYLLRDDAEDALGLPSGDYEIPLVLQDRTFSDDGSLEYQAASDTDVDDSIKPEDFGNVSVVNGAIWPVLEVEPRKYRLRMLNGSNSRFYNIILRDRTTAAEDGPGFVQVGSDGGLLPAPVPIDGRLLMAPAERADCVVDFSGFENREFVLHTNAKTPYKSDEQASDEVTLEEVMLFRVKSTAANDDSRVPEQLATIAAMDPAKAAVTREIALIEGEDQQGRLHLLLDGKMWDDPISEKPKVGSTEVWRLANPTEDVHPIHLHLVQFQVLGRTPFDAERYLKDLEESKGEDRGSDEMGEAMPARKLAFKDYITGPMEKPAANEMGWKDTVRANPGYITDIIATFDQKGRYVWHCHILEHEDHEMMRPFEVQ